MKNTWIRIQIALQFTCLSYKALVNFKWAIVCKDIQHRELAPKVAISILELFLWCR